MTKLLMIIPAFNEGGNIKNVMDELKGMCGQYDYLIINDGSSDNTEEICKNNNYNYISLPVNVGLSGVFRIGMKYADRYGYDMAIQYDGDGQHDPSYISGMMQLMNEKKADIVIGSRYLIEKGKISLRNFGSMIIRGLIKVTTGKKIADPTSGMRLYNKKMIRIFSRNINMPPEPDTIAYLINCGYKVEEMQVTMRERQEGTSYLNIGNSIKYMLNIILSIVFIQCFRRKKL
jgi:glycosyltransferase involved in cell wall biosynthesis